MNTACFGHKEVAIMIKRTVVALSLTAFALANTAAAQENATITLRSGERLSAQVMDMSGAGFTARVNGQERQIPTNDVAVIDFTGGGGSQSDWDRLSSGQFVVLKDGQILTGQLTDIGGSAPLRAGFLIKRGERGPRLDGGGRRVPPPPHAPPP